LHVPAVRKRPGILSGVFLAGYGIFRSIGELWREPDAQLGFIFEHISMGQILSVPVIALGLGILVYALKRAPVVTNG
jgi:phosphatidylglycerol:prolipoprotein diacylglycerol transferase